MWLERSGLWLVEVGLCEWVDCLMIFMIVVLLGLGSREDVFRGKGVLM